MLRCLTLVAALSVAGLASAAEPKVLQRWAVLIGVDDYAYAQKLQYCGADQRALRDQLVASGFPADHVFLLHDKDEDQRLRPSKGNIERHLELVLNLADAEDLVVIGFSGHGVHVGGKSFLCPGDCTLDDPKSLIGVDDVYDRLKACAAGFKLVLVDACRNDPRPGGTRSMTATEGTRALARTLQELKVPEGVVLLNSRAPGEVSWEDEQFAHGVFMHFVLDGLHGPADTSGDGHVSLLELQSYAGTKTKTYVANRHRVAQRPFFKGDLTTEALEYALLPVKAKAAAALPSVPTVTAPAAPAPPAVGFPSNAKPGDVVTNSIGMKLAFIPAGEFQMGSPDAIAADFKDEGPQHRVRITKSFYMGIHEVTQGQWQAAMGTTPWSSFKGPDTREGADYPASWIKWEDAPEFCRKLSAKEGKTYRLPTEAEWEYACRAGTTTEFHFGADFFTAQGRIDDYAWLDRNSYGAERYPHAVGQKKPNPWGLYDMMGNVREWCDDLYDANYYKTSPTDDPKCESASDAIPSRVTRGGSVGYGLIEGRSPRRHGDGPTSGGNGFRVVAIP